MWQAYIVDNVTDTSEQPMETSPSLFVSVGSEPNLAQQLLDLNNGVFCSMDMNLGSTDILDDFLHKHTGPPNEFA